MKSIIISSAILFVICAVNSAPLAPQIEEKFREAYELPLAGVEPTRGQCMNVQYQRESIKDFIEANIYDEVDNDTDYDEEQKKEQHETNAELRSYGRIIDELVEQCEKNAPHGLTLEMEFEVREMIDFLDDAEPTEETCKDKQFWKSYLDELLGLYRDEQKSTDTAETDEIFKAELIKMSYGKLLIDDFMSQCAKNLISQ